MNAFAKILMDHHTPAGDAASLVKARDVTVPLREYQLVALNALLAGAVYLALDMGLGKTRILIEFARAIGARRIVVVCPKSVVPVWAAEFRKWWPDSPVVTIGARGFAPLSTVYPGYSADSASIQPSESGIWLLTYDAMIRQPISTLLDETPDAPDIDLVLVDEAHFAKNGSAKRTKAVFGGLRKRAAHMIAASGTPAPNHAGELYAPLRALAPEVLRLPNGRLMSQVEFEDAFCVVQQRFFYNRAVRLIAGSKNMTALRAKLEGVFIRMKKADVLPQLPPLAFVLVPINPTTAGVEAALLEQYADIITEAMDDEQVVRALQSRDEHIARMRAVLGLAKAAAAVDYLTDFLEGNNLKVLVWAEHHSVIDLLAERLADYRPVVIDGRSSQSERKAAVDLFLNDPKTRVFIGNVKAAGTGLTLIGPHCECRDEFFVEMSYTPGDNFQAAARIHRLGQSDGVLCRVFTASGTIDDRIQQIITRKTAELAELFG